MRVKKDDTVVVIAGKDKGKKGKVVAVLPKQDKVVVEGVNQVKKNVKASPQNPNSGIITKEAAIDASNVMLLHEGKPTRVGYKVTDGVKQRIAKSTGEVID